MSKTKLQYWLIQILLILTIIFVSTKITFLFEPIGVFFSTIFFPILITGFLYFLLNPVVKFLHRHKVPKSLGILIIYIAFFGLVGLAVGNLVPIISKQFTALGNALPGYANQVMDFFEDFTNSSEFKWIQDEQQQLINTIEEKVIAFANTLPNRITGGISQIIGFVTNIAIILVTVPFLLFYMFKDGDRFPHAIARFFPTVYRDEALTILKETGETLSAYIQGQVTVALAVGTLSFIGYLIIDLPFALVMALIVAVTNIIPYVGPFLGGAPAVIVALFDSPTKALLVVLVIVIAQQIEGNVLSPLILGKTLDTHPATIIILLLAAGNLAGVLGMILAIPTYAVIKTIVINIVKFLKAKKKAELTADL
ncbi:AI-2E family transporter [Bacillus sp. HNG]|uniref:AI-2E family transporter n=1 Tax=Bacillus sp. HNG TaxID=2293325 RepID=UPI000E2FCA09|nr:AI-2E family transporter [Bacillus sp. HNG]RFB18883.1 AI-2E family transporter [Bacillus sp. HNG]